MLLTADDRAAQQAGQVVALADRLLQRGKVGAGLLEATSFLG
jgi:hypothetical protein